MLGFCLDAVVVCRCVFSTDIFLRVLLDPGKGGGEVYCFILPCIDVFVECVFLASGYVIVFTFH
jgi:hypothetical protein